MMNFTIFAKITDKKIISNLKNRPELPFSNVLPLEKINEKMEDLSYRERIFTPMVTLLAFLSQVMDDDQSQQAAVAKVVATYVANGEEPPSTNTSAYSQARSRLPEDFISNLVREIAKASSLNIPDDWLWKGRKVKLIDGSTVSMPDTERNQNIYPQPDTQKTGVGFPIARIAVLIDYITGMVVDLAICAYSGKETGEHALFRQLMSSFVSGDVVLGDRYYPSFFVMASLMKLGIAGVFPMHSVRKYDLAKLYDYRWFVEISLRDIKTTMHMDILRGKTPDMIRKEIWAHLLAYNLIRKIMIQSAVIHEKSTKELSFKLALQMVKAFQQKGILDDGNHEVYLNLLKAISNKKVGHRSGRQEPRCVKRRPKAFPRLQKARGSYKNVA